MRMYFLYVCINMNTKAHTYILNHKNFKILNEKILGLRK